MVEKFASYFKVPDNLAEQGFVLVEASPGKRFSEVRCSANDKIWKRHWWQGHIDLLAAMVEFNEHRKTHHDAAVEIVRLVGK